MTLLSAVKMLPLYIGCGSGRSERPSVTRCVWVTTDNTYTDAHPSYEFYF